MNRMRASLEASTQAPDMHGIAPRFSCTLEDLCP